VRLTIHDEDAAGIGSVSADIVLSTTAAFAWDVIRDVYSVATRLIPGFATAVDAQPQARIVTFVNGLTVTERIVELDDAARRLVYQVVDGPTTYHLGTQQITEDADGVHLVWTTAFAPASLRDITQTSMAAAANLMEATINAGFHASYSLPDPPVPDED
jgi:hypothetical protein